MYSITINFQSIQFSDEITNGKDKIKISATTFPGQIKQSIVVDPKNINNKNHIINLKVDKDFKMLIFLFEKKNIFQFNPLIASRAIEVADITTTEFKNIEQKTFNIYKPIHRQDNEANHSSRIVGKITIQCYINSTNSPYDISKIHKGNGYSSINENDNRKFLLQDD